MSVIIQPLVASCKPVSTSAWNLSPRTIPEDQNEEESDDYQLMFKHFKENKVEIASAITKPFLLLISRRDRDFISGQKFQVSVESELSPDSKPALCCIMLYFWVQPTG